MEASILLGLLGAGYILNRNNDNNNDNDNRDLPEQDNAYSTDYFHDTNKSQELPTSLYDEYKTTKIPGVKNINYQNIGEYLNMEDNIELKCSEEPAKIIRFSTTFFERMNTKLRKEK